MNQQPQAILPTNPLPLSDLQRRSVRQRIEAANRMWGSVMQDIHTTSPLSGAVLLMGLSSFTRELIDDEVLCDRIEQHLKVSLCNEGPRPQGKLFP